MLVIFNEFFFFKKKKATTTTTIGCSINGSGKIENPESLHQGASKDDTFCFMHLTSREESKETYIDELKERKREPR